VLIVIARLIVSFTQRYSPDRQQRMPFSSRRARPAGVAKPDR